MSFLSSLNPSLGELVFSRKDLDFIVILGSFYTIYFTFCPIFEAIDLCGLHYCGRSM
jgi:hypothetical protein